LEEVRIKKAPRSGLVQRFVYAVKLYTFPEKIGLLSASPSKSIGYSFFSLFAKDKREFYCIYPPEANRFPLKYQCISENKAMYSTFG